MNELDGKRVAMLAADGFVQSELIVPKRRLEEAGAKVDIISLNLGLGTRRLGRSDLGRPHDRCGPGR